MSTKQQATALRRQSVLIGLVYAAIFTTFGQFLRSGGGRADIRPRNVFGIDVSSWPDSLVYSPPLTFAFMTVCSSIMVYGFRLLTDRSGAAAEGTKTAAKALLAVLAFASLGGVCMATIGGWVEGVFGFVCFIGFLAAFVVVFGVILCLVWIARQAMTALAHRAELQRLQRPNGLVSVVSTDANGVRKRLGASWRGSRIRRYLNAEEVPPNK